MERYVPQVASSPPFRSGSKGNAFLSKRRVRKEEKETRKGSLLAHPPTRESSLEVEPTAARTNQGPWKESCGWNGSMDARKAGARCIALERSGLHGCQFRCICVGGFLRVVKTRVAPLVQEGSSPFLPGHPCQRILLVLKLAHGIPCGWIRSYMLALAKWFGLGLTSFRLGVQRR